VIEELIALGADTFIRIGTCASLTPELAIGDVVRVEAAVAMDGASRALGADERVEPDAQLSARIDAPGAIAASVDLFYDGPEPDGADVVEMECATLFQIAKLRGAHAAAVVGVSDTLSGGRRRIEPEQLEALGLALGEAAWAALTR
jgi:uridine phosphorylase